MSQNKKEGYNRMIGNEEHMTNPRILDSKIVFTKNRKVFYDDYPYASKVLFNKPSIRARTVVVPLPFYFTKHSSLSLPLCALQTNEVYITIETENIEKLYQIYDNTTETFMSSKKYNELNGTNISIKNFTKTIDINPYLECKYIYLDDKEWRLVTLNKHNSTFVVEHLYKKDIEVTDNVVNIELNFSTPVKELIWVIKRNDYLDYNTPFNYTGSLNENDNLEILKTAKILWNRSNERVEQKDAMFFGKIQPYQHHTNVPKTGIYCYSFSIYPEKWYPTGHFNPTGKYPISTNLQLELNKYDNEGYEVIVYAKIYNILYINGGLGGFKWS